MGHQASVVAGPLPLVGALVSACLFIYSATLYPGGTTVAADTVGFDWTTNFVCSLFAATSLNGAANPARYFAIAAMFIFCASVAFLFHAISTRARTKAQRKTISIAGINAMVYAFFIVTPMHDLMVGISLVFFVVAMLAVLRFVFVERERRLFLAGLVCLALLIFNSTIYYGAVLFELLPIAQKVTTVASVAWLFAVYYGASRNTDIIEGVLSRPRSEA